MTEKIIDEYFTHFLSSLSCAGNKELSWFNEDFVLLKHTKHTSYVNRMAGTTSCNTYYLLVNVGTATPQVVRYGHLRKETGVWNFPSRIVDEHRRKIQKITGAEIPKMLEHWQPYLLTSSCWKDIRLKLYELELKRVIDTKRKKT